MNDESPDPPGWISLPASLLNEAGVVRLRESPERNRQLLVRQLLDGIYPHPFVLDDGKVRRLHFTLRLVQSEMRIAAPWELAVAYTQAMLGFLLFQPAPKHIVIVGLGGGSLTKYCHRHCPRSRITTVEVSEGVIACRDWFLLPPDDERLRIRQQDAADYFAGPPDGADVILLDAYDEDGVAPQLCTAAFYADARAHLKPRGVLVANISGHSQTAETHIALMREAFNGRIAIADVSTDGNRIVYAFNDPTFPPDWKRLTRAARMLSDAHPCDFMRLLRDLERSVQRDRRRR
ncbi:spermidine synthase-like protein [Uliginosibacterium sp. H1]|uniref:spermine/spermidine synthase domain-containing protein n=1 Tax=Uliginosibacterium sp. H1 TaxID=3114757 RepID=UPI002E17B22B|nr:spermidine synthase-like protein [Uliginosibacterium sp. H1]